MRDEQVPETTLLGEIAGSLAAGLFYGLLMWFAIWYIATVIGIYEAHRPFDATDAPPVRSGLSLYTDAATGCQYVTAGWFGGPVPRLGRDGKQMCGGVP